MSTHTARLQNRSTSLRGLVLTRPPRAGRRSSLAEAAALFFGLAAASDWCTECSQLCHKCCAVETNHAPQPNAGYGLAFEPVENGSLGDAGDLGGFGYVQQAVGLIVLIH